MRFTASVMLAHESLLQKLTLPHSRDSQHPSCWFMNPCYKTCSAPSTEFQYLSCWLLNLCCCLRTALVTRFSASVMLAHESLPLNLHSSIHEIHSICHDDPWISGAKPALLYSQIHSIRHAVSMPYPWDPNISLAGLWISAAKLELPYPQDSQHFPCWLMNLCYNPCTALSTEFTAFWHAGSRFCANVFIYCHIYEVHSICRAGSWIGTANLALPYPRDSQHLSCWLIILSCCPCPFHEIHSICHTGSWVCADYENILRLQFRQPSD
jgi:hypothetical protein